MIRKTISIDEALFAQLKEEGILEHFRNFSDLVSTSLQQTIESIKRENYRREIGRMANDPMVINDIEEVNEDFKYADGELNAF
jgi:hypothetical protein